MLTSYDIDRIVYDLLNTAEVRGTLSGGVYYQNDRPDGSGREDIVINTITITQETHPQRATSNVNIYVPDRLRRIEGREQYKPDHARLSELSRLVIQAIRASRIRGLKIIPESMAILSEPSIRQHFCNLRLVWNIQA